LPDVSSIYNDYDKSVAELGNLQEFEASTKSANENINSIIDEFQDKLPTGTKISTLQFSSTGIIMTVMISESDAGANAIQAKLYTQMETIEYFDKVDISYDSSEEGEVSSLLQFTINCTYKP
jgi:hypothetical protein